MTVDAHSSLGSLPFGILEPEQARQQPSRNAAVTKVGAERGLDGHEEVGGVEELRVPDSAGGEQTLRVYTPRDAGPGPVT